MNSYILKLALFATGLSGIVAEYILSTLATYFLGDSVFQWTMIVSVMLFSMGVGSRLSKFIEKDLMIKFIHIELLLSFLVGYSSLFAYTIAAYSAYAGIVIYSLSIVIGILIGMEIPLVIRLNEQFEELKINVASVMEKDYLGSLAGGFFFAFVGLPYLGLTYTPFSLALVNFLVAMGLFFVVRKSLPLNRIRSGVVLSLIVAIVIVAGFFIARPIILFGEQARYKDKVVFEVQSKYQRIVVTQWKDDYWLFINGNQQLCTKDEAMYHEVLVHPAMKTAKHVQDVLIFGGGDGCAAREVLKYPHVKSIKLVDLDPEMTKMGQENEVLVDLNRNSLNNSKVEIVNKDGFVYIEKDTSYYDVIIIDLPDPRTVELGRLYSVEFYKMCKKHIRPGGVIVTQAGSPYYAAKAFRCIDKTMSAAGFSTIPLHNQVITLGEWGWVLGVNDSVDPAKLKKYLQSLNYQDIETQWINNEAMDLITSFGKDFFINSRDSIYINKVHEPHLYKYYLKGSWDLY